MLLDESPITVPAPDGKAIHAVWSRCREANRHVVLALHGLAGQPDDFVLRYARDRVLAAGLDMCRPAFHSWQRDARTLRETTLAIQAGDLAAVFAWLQVRYADIYLVGHSYGGIAILVSGVNAAKAVSLWDCRFAPARLWSRAIPCEPTADPEVLVVRDALRFQIGRRMRDEGLGYTDAVMRRLAAGFTVPVQILVAGEGGIDDPSDPYAPAFAGPSETVVIPGANHAFTNGHAADALCRETLRWFGQAGRGFGQAGARA